MPHVLRISAFYPQFCMFLPRMHCTKMASSGDKSKLKKKPKTLAEKGKNRFLGNDMKGGGQGGV